MGNCTIRRQRLPSSIRDEVSPLDLMVIQAPHRQRRLFHDQVTKDVNKSMRISYSIRRQIDADKTHRNDEMRFSSNIESTSASC